MYMFSLFYINYKWNIILMVKFRYYAQITCARECGIHNNQYFTLILSQNRNFVKRCNEVICRSVTYSSFEYLAFTKRVKRKSLLTNLCPLVEPIGRKFGMHLRNWQTICDTIHHLLFRLTKNTWHNSWPQHYTSYLWEWFVTEIFIYDRFTFAYEPLIFEYFFSYTNYVLE